MAVRLYEPKRDYQRFRHTPQEEWALAKKGFQSVTSSNVSAIGINIDDLLIRFQNGSVYRYYGQAESYASLLGSVSKGKWVWRHLRRKGVPYNKETNFPLPDDIDIDDDNLFGELDDRFEQEVGQYVGGVESVVILTEWGKMNVSQIGGVELYRILAR